MYVKYHLFVLKLEYIAYKSILSILNFLSIFRKLFLVIRMKHSCTVLNLIYQGLPNITWELN